MDIASKKGDNSFGREIQYKVSDPLIYIGFLRLMFIRYQDTVVVRA